MLAAPLSAVNRRLVLALTTGLALTLAASPALAQASGGFVEKADSTAIRPRWTASDIQAFLPQRGKLHSLRRTAPKRSGSRTRPTAAPAIA